MHRLILAAVLAVAPAAAFGQGARDNIDALIEQQAKANGVPASFVHAVVKRESNYNPRAKGGSALGLMQIKHATARSLGYTGDAAGLYDPETNLRYGVAYLAGAYRTAKGNVSQAYQYYNRGYYYAAKRQGISTEVASVVAPVAASASALASLFGGGVADTRNNPAAAALAYAPTAAAVAEVPTETVEVPLPPRRPAALAGATIELASLSIDPAAAAPGPAPGTAQAAAAPAVEVPLPPRRPAALGSAVAAAAPAQIAELRLSPQPEAPPAAMTPAAAPAPATEAAVEAVEVPLPPRRPSLQMLAAATPRRAPAAAPVQEATALPVE
ncbi:lytic transglycosylase domain-containing protein [Methylobacterium radiotolerans]|uniref:lytic transglycosylase domain-containing protein n=1 Tax=Methylobacterium radiotolerans TaxID=31998 RepID=UPI0005DC7373|nr:transglycosylase SLT domain-containing protein [Methylobacterium radiotolerans]OXE38578.1 lytic transglycosylase [Methylobacterium radiotolerans]GAN50028.1 lytic transglycosylase [Methylobacterium sp. ME121]